MWVEMTMGKEHNRHRKLPCLFKYISSLNLNFNQINFTNSNLFPKEKKNFKLKSISKRK